MMTDRSIPIARPSMGEAEWEALREPIESGWLTQGPKVQEFEAAFAHRHQVPHATAVANGTAALHLALAAAGIGPGDEVIVPAFTWVATANAAVYCGATPVLVDVSTETFNVDPERLAAAVTDHTRAVVPVHLFGLCADMDAVRRAVPPAVPLLEDAACAAGSAYHGRPAGGLGDIAAFSFHPRKSITTGEGGMVTTARGDWDAAVRRLRNHGLPEGSGAGGTPGTPGLPDIAELGFNYRMTDLQAALGLVQLPKLDAFVAERDRWASWYATALADILWLRPPVVPEGYVHAWQSYVLLVAEDAPVGRDELMSRLSARGVAVRPGTHAVSELSYYRERFDVRAQDFPGAAAAHHRTLAIPLHNTMTTDDYEYVAEVLHEIAASAG